METYKQKIDFYLSRKSLELDKFSDILDKFDLLSKKLIVEIDFASYKAAAKDFPLESLFDKLESDLADYCSADLFDIFQIDFDNFKATFNIFKANWLHTLETEKQTFNLVCQEFKIENSSFNINASTSNHLEVSRLSDNLTNVLTKFDYLEKQNFLKDEMLKRKDVEIKGLLVKLKDLEESTSNGSNQNKLGMHNEALVIDKLNEALEKKCQDNSKLRNVIESLVENYMEDADLETYLSSEKLIELVEHEISEKSIEKLRFAFRCICEIAQNTEVAGKVNDLKDNLNTKSYFEAFKESVLIIRNELIEQQNRQSERESIIASNIEKIKSLETKLKNLESIRKVSITRRNTDEDIRTKLAKVESNPIKIKEASSTFSNDIVSSKLKELEEDNSRLISQKVSLAQEYDNMRSFAESLVEERETMVSKKLVANMVCNYFSKKSGKKNEKGILESLAEVLEFSEEERKAVGLAVSGIYVSSEGSTMQQTARLPVLKNLFKFG